MWPGLDERRAQLMDLLHRDPPAFILVGQGDRNGFEPMDSFTSLMRFRELKGMLQDGYVQDAPLGRFLVYRRRAHGPDVNP
jgi:hypothetical protein